MVVIVMRKNEPVTQEELDYPEDLEIISSTDLKGKITYANDDFINVSGFSREELYGKAHNLVRHPDVPPAIFANLWEELKKGKPWIGVVKNRCKNGDHYWVNAYVTPIYENGEVCGFESVRSKPSAKEKQRAEDVYKEVWQNKSNRFKSWWSKCGIGLKIYASFILSLMPFIAFLITIPDASVLINLAVLFLSLGMAFYGCFRVTKRLREVATKSRQVIENDLLSWFYTGYSDEAGQLELALKIQAAKIKTVLGRVRESAQELKTEAERTTAASNSSTEALFNQQRDTHSVATAMEEMSTTIHEIAKTVQNAYQLADETDKQSQHSKEVVGTAMTAILELADRVKDTSVDIQNLDNDCEKIGDVLNVIQDIADQTNLLALNAAIESARAGEHGAGFAVVADEVRTLARRTQDSTRDIEDIINTLRTAAKKAVNTMELGSEQAMNCVEQGRTVVSELDVISTQVSEINGMNQLIASATEEQSAVSTEMSQNIIRISDATDDTSAQAKETLNASENLTSSANNMNMMLLRFKS